MLTDIAIRKFKGAERPYKKFDKDGLLLLILPTGVRGWRFKYRFEGKEKQISFGVYPEVSLSEARSRCDAARAQLRNGLNPSAERQRIQAPAVAVSTFESVAREWHKLQLPKWKPQHGASVLAQLESDVFPDLGAKPIVAITPPMVLATIRTIEARGAIDTARRLRQRMSAIFVYGIASGVCANDPAAIIASAMAPMKPGGRRPAITDRESVRAVLPACDAADGAAVIKLAMRLLALTAVRPGEAAGATWVEFEGLDGDAPIWRIPKERMKGELGSQVEHLVPLSRQAVATINAIRPITGQGTLLFPNRRSRKLPMAGQSLSSLLDRAGYKGHHVPHGWRSAFSTIMNEVAEREGRPGDRAIIDLMLAHTSKDPVEKIYNRSAYMPRRRELGQAWADALMQGVAEPAAIVNLPVRVKQPRAALHGLAPS
ncbi:MAG: tyrosine-type recombinase/integrase [Sphingomonas sp.]